MLFVLQDVVIFNGDSNFPRGFGVKSGVAGLDIFVEQSIYVTQNSPLVPVESRAVHHLHVTILARRRPAGEATPSQQNTEYSRE